MKIKYLLLFILPLSMLTMCQNAEQNIEKSTSEEDISETSSDLSENKLSEEDKFRVKDLINSIGPPLEMGYIMQDIDLKFSSTPLCPYDIVELYDNSLDKAALMGIFGADMVYCLIHNRNDMVAKYIESIQQIAEDLNLAKVLNFEKMRKLSEEKINAQKLATEYTTQMEKVSNHLSQTNQLDINAMIAYGGWVESMFIASSTGIDLGENSKEAIELVVYETTMAKLFLEVFDHFESIEQRGTIIKDLKELKDLYDQFKVEEQKAEPIVRQSDEMTQVIDPTTQDIKFENKDVDRLLKHVEKLRSSLINKK